MILWHIESVKVVVLGLYLWPERNLKTKLRKYTHYFVHCSRKRMNMTSYILFSFLHNLFSLHENPHATKGSRGDFLWSHLPGFHCSLTLLVAL